MVASVFGLAVENQQRVHVIQPHPTTAGQFWVGGDLGLFTTTNGGETFALQSFGSAVRDIVWMSDSTVVLALADHGVIRSTDGGASWTTPTRPSDLESVGRIPLAGESWENSAVRDTMYRGWPRALQQFLGILAQCRPGETWEAMATRDSGPNLLGVAVDGRTTWDKPSGTCAWK